MKFIRDPQSVVTVRHVEKGLIRVGGENITEDVVLFRNTIQRGWSTPDLHKLSEADFEDLILQSPEIIIFGSGWTTMLPPRELVFSMARRGIGFEIMDTPAACRTFNILVAEDRDVAAVLVLG